MKVNGENEWVEESYYSPFTMYYSLLYLPYGYQ